MSAVFKYNLKPCPFCGNPISNLNKYGFPIQWTKYKKKQTCGRTSCLGASMSRNSRVQIKPQTAFYREPDIVELFYLGKLT